MLEIPLWAAGVWGAIWTVIGFVVGIRLSKRDYETRIKNVMQGYEEVMRKHEKH